MTDSGISLKDDIASIRTDPIFHDVVLVCADGVEIGACRAILASRSAVFKAMLYGNMQESISGRVSFQDIKSTAMHAVLRFIHTEDIDSNAISVAVEVYRAASFFLLPKLMHLVLNRAQDITDFNVAISLLNEAAVSVPRNDNTEELYDVVFKPFCANSLAVGDLNKLSDKALELLLTYTNTAGFKTSEYNLLLCVIEWVWAHDTAALPAAERHAIFDDINSLPSEHSIKIRLQSKRSRTALLKLLDHFDFALLCPHRLNCLIKSINVLDELPRYTWAFCYHACENTKCSPTHPSRFRGDPSPSQFRGEPSPHKLQWDRSKLVDDLVFSEEGTVVEYLKMPNSPQTIIRIPKIVRASTKCSADQDGMCKWTIVIESLGITCFSLAASVGLVEESWNNSLSNLSQAGWCFYISRSIFGGSSSTFSIFCKDSEIRTIDEVPINNGAVVTFHLNWNNRTCALSINGHDCGVAWRDLPINVNLYPAVGLERKAKYRIKPYQ